MFMSSFLKISRNFHSRCTKGSCGKMLLVCDLKRQGCFQGCADEKCREQKEGFMWERFNPEALFVLHFSLIFFICFIPFSPSQRITAEKVWGESLQLSESRLWHIMASIDAGACERRSLRFVLCLLAACSTDCDCSRRCSLAFTDWDSTVASSWNKQRSPCKLRAHTPKVPHKHLKYTVFTRALYFKPPRAD